MEVTAKKEVPLEEKGLKIREWLEEKKAEDIVLLDIRDYGSITDLLILATGANTRHNQSLADWILEKVSEEEWEYLGMEGYKAGNWILIDLNEVLVHIFSREVREFYNLEALWRDARRL